MTGSRADRRPAGRPTRLAAAAFCLSVLGGALAPGSAWGQQTRAPIQLAPPTPLGPPPTSDADAAPSVAPVLPAPADPAPPAVSGPDPAARTTADGAIRIQTLDRLTIDSTGTLTPGAGGLGTDLWAGTPGPVALRLVQLLPAAPDSRALARLARRLLLSAGAAPPDLAEEGSLLAVRAERLLAMGAMNELSALAALLAVGDPPRALARVLATRALAAGQTAQACGLADRIAETGDDRYWIKVGILCDLSRGNHAKAEFGARLLVELREADPLVTALVQGGITGQKGSASELQGAEPIHLALAVATDYPIDPDVTTIRSLPVLVALASGLGGPPFDVRLAAAEKAERAGALPPESLEALYREVAVQGGTVDSALTLAEADPGPYARAVLWRTAEAQTDASERLRVIRTALDLADDAASWRQTARLYRSLLVRLIPGSKLDSAAPDVIRALIAAGDPGAAEPWVTRLRRRVENGDPAAARDWWSLWAVARIGGGDALVAYDEPSVDSWWRRIRDSDPHRAVDRGAAALALMEALGEPVGIDVWRGLVGLPPTGPVESPTAAFRFGVSRGAAAGRTGETVAMAVASFGEVPLGDLDPTAVSTVVRALVQLGLPDEARRVAAEAAIAYGL